MSPWLTLVFLLILLLPLALGYGRPRLLFRVALRSGKLHVERGAPPRALLDDLEDVLKHPEPTKTVIRVALRGQDDIRISMAGDLTPSQQQQIRNVIGLYPARRLARR